MNNTLTNNTFKDYLYAGLGSALVAVSLACFFEPNGLVTGGVTGLAIIIADIGQRVYNIDIPLALTNIVLNVPLFLLAFKTKGKGFLARTLFATLFLSFCLSLAELLPEFSSDTDLTIYAVFGAVIQGIGMGLIFRSKSTTGGTDLLASVIHNYLKHISIAKILFVIDTSILVLGFFVFGARKSMYAIIAGYIVSKLTDTVLEGFDFAKAAFIISDRQKEIAAEFMEMTDRGATVIRASGVYTGKDKHMLMIIMSNKELVTMKEIIKSIDPTAFVIVTDVREALGEGFRQIN